MIRMSSRGSAWIAIALGLVSIGTGAARAAPGPQGASSPASSPQGREMRLTVARRIMTAARFCTLVTQGPEGRAQARVIDPLGPGPGLEIYFATNPKSRKVAEIRRDRRVTLLYFDATAMAYVTLIGDASPVTGLGRSGLYKDEWAGFFPRDTPDAWALYRVRPIRVEIVSAADGLSGDSVTWRPDSVEMR